MNAIEKTRADEIVRLHGEIEGLFKMSLDKAMRIGELLAEQKATMKHGEFTPWVKGNLPFTDRTARNYMRVYRNQKRLKTETVSVLGQAYRLLSGQEEDGFDEQDIDDVVDEALFGLAESLIAEHEGQLKYRDIGERMEIVAGKLRKKTKCRA